jgi:predicted transcriptional regulator
MFLEQKFQMFELNIKGEKPMGLLDKGKKELKEFFIECAKDEDLTKKDFRVLFYLMTKLNDEEFIRIPQKKVAKVLDLGKSTVSKSFSNLVSLNIIEEGITEDDEKGYRFINF